MTLNLLVAKTIAIENIFIEVVIWAEFDGQSRCSHEERKRLNVYVAPVISQVLNVCDLI
jgi:hypothetical protein